MSDGMKCSDQISSFLTFLRETRQERNVSESIQSDTDNETQDILHCLELDTESDMGCLVKLMEALRDVRRRRRVAKDRAQVTQLIADWSTQNAGAVNSLERLLGEVRKAEKRTENRYYNPKTDIVKRIFEESRGTGSERHESNGEIKENQII